MNENKSAHETIIGVALLVGLVVIAVFLLVTAGVRWYLSPENQLSIVQRRDLVQGLASAGQALAVALTGAVGLGGLFFTWRNTNQARESTQRTLQLTEEGQITERFTRAVDQLGASEGGNKNIELRMGGIYALERISKESDEDYWSIMELLSAYVREHAALNPTVEPEADELSHEEFQSSHKDPDIQTIMTVIGRRRLHYPEEPRRLVLDRIDLSWAWLYEANLTGAFLDNSRLKNINAQDANFQNASLYKANLVRAYLLGANFIQATLQETSLEGATLTGANLERADVRDANFARANLAGVLNLTQDQLDGADGDEKTRLPDSLTRPAHWITNGSEAHEAAEDQEQD